MLYKLSSRVAFMLFVVSTIIACGGGGGSDNAPTPAPTPTPTPTPAPTPTPMPPPPADGSNDNDTAITVTGGGIKGPLANASVAVYQVDLSRSDLLGERISLSTTDERAQIEELKISSQLEGPFIFAFSSTDDTIDLTTGQKPILKNLFTIVTKSQITEKHPIYATSLTTVAFHLVKSAADSTILGGDEDGVITENEVFQALNTADTVVRSTLGFGVSEDVDIFHTAPILDGQSSNEQLRPIAEYRAAVEAFASTVFHLSEQSNNQATPDRILSELALDLTDGNLDQSHGDQAINSYSIDTLVEHSGLRGGLTIAGDESNRSIDNIVQILIGERNATGFNDAPIDGLLSINDDLLVTPISLNADLDGDGIFNSEDQDDDGDSVVDTIDQFPHDESENADTDGDGIGNNADEDDDGDGQLDINDDFPLDGTKQHSTDKDGDRWPVGQDTDDSDASVPALAWKDTDGDGFADEGGLQPDNDDDNDGVEDAIDAFPLDAAESKDFDGDGIGDNADNDIDGDGVLNASDLFPYNANETLDTDGDGIGNHTDTDDDNDGTPDSIDTFPLDSTEFADTDGDGIGNNADEDDDNDGVLDANDAFPLNASASAFNDSDGDGWPVGQDNDDTDPNSPVLAFIDTDQDGLANEGGLAPDTDDDNDGVLDINDWAPLDPTESKDTDNDGIGDNADIDRDGDGVKNSTDKFPLNPSEWNDTDGDGIGDNSDKDADNDGVANEKDAFPLDSAEWLDTDADGVGNNRDNDDDNDGFPDFEDAFPLNAAESEDFDGDGLGNNEDTDDDNDSVPDVTDVFPLNPNESSDSDGDGIGDNADTNSGNTGGSTPPVIAPPPVFPPPPPPPQSGTTKITGAGVSGPMAYADVVLYKLDMSQSDYKGEIIGVTTTNKYAQFVGLRIPNSSVPPYLLEVKGVKNTSLDITTGSYPIIDQLRTLVTKEMLDNGNSIYATTLTTMATDIALSQADSGQFPFSGNSDGISTTIEVTKALDAASAMVKSTLGFGLDNIVDLFKASPVIDKDINTEPERTSVVALRSAVEAAATSIYNMQQASKTNKVLATDIMNDLAKDLSDGVIDTKVKDVGVSSYTLTTLAELNKSPDTLRIPNTNIAITDITSLLIKEAKEIGNDAADLSAFEKNNVTFKLKKAQTSIDTDGDSVLNYVDAFPNDASADSDFDGDGKPDIAFVMSNGKRSHVVDENRSDNDDDNDGVLDANDDFPFNPNEQKDTDSDGIGNNADTDDDNDGVLDANDDFPLDATRQESKDRDNDGWPIGQDPDDNDIKVPAIAWKDSDQDGFADEGGLNPDDDDDNDGVKDVFDLFPKDPRESRDLDGDGIGNNADTDIDGDGVANVVDAFPFDLNETIDTDGDGVGNNTDLDDDNDGVTDDKDAFALDPSEHADSDGDGVGDNADDFPQNKDVQIGTKLSDLVIPDANLSACLKDSLDQTRFAESVALINCNGRPIANLTGVEKLSQLKTVYLEGIHTISDYKPLTLIKTLENLKVQSSGFDNKALTLFANHPSLYHIDVSKSGVTDLSAAANIPALGSLYLWGSKVFDISPLASLRNFEYLAVNSSQVKNINDLRRLTQLKSLWLHGSLTSEAKAAILSLPALQYLSIGYSNTVDDKFFTDLVNTHKELRWLTVHNTAITSIDGIEKLSQLNQLNISKNSKLSDLTPLLNGSKLTLPLNSLNIDELSLYDMTQVASLNNLGVGVTGEAKELEAVLPTFDDAELTKCVESAATSIAQRITHLDCAGHPISNLSGIAQLSKLTHINLTGVKTISDFSPLAEVSTLEYLEVSETNFDDKALSGFVNHASLSHIRAEFAGITDISDAANIPQLQSLHLRGSAVYDISSLAGLRYFDTLVLGSHQIKDISELTNLPYLKNLWLKGQLSSEGKSTILLLTELERLAVGYSDSVDDPFFTNVSNTLTDLKTLNMHDSSISTIDGIDNLFDLKELVVADNNRLTDLSPLIHNGGLTVPLTHLNLDKLMSLIDLTPAEEIRKQGVDVVGKYSLALFPTSCSTTVELNVVSATDDGTNDGNVPAEAIDGDLDQSSRWSSEGTGKQIVFDLGRAARVTDIKLAWFKGDQRTAYFDIESSLDNQKWTSVLSNGQSSGATLGLEAIDVLDSGARYIRLTGKTNSSNKWNSLVEAKLFGCTN